MDVLVKVYLNEGPDHYSGFHNLRDNDPRLRLAAAFTVQVLEANSMPSQDYPRWLLENIYDQLNVGEDEPWVVAYRAEGNRSLSVGDVVVVSSAVMSPKAYSCEQMGWVEVEDDDLTAAIRRFNLDGAMVR